MAQGLKASLEDPVVAFDPHSPDLGDVKSGFEGDHIIGHQPVLRTRHEERRLGVGQSQAMSGMVSKPSIRPFEAKDVIHGLMDQAASAPAFRVSSPAFMAARHRSIISRAWNRRFAHGQSGGEIANGTQRARRKNPG